MNQVELFIAFKADVLKLYPKTPVTNPMNSRHADMWTMYQVGYVRGQTN